MNQINFNFENIFNIHCHPTIDDSIIICQKWESEIKIYLKNNNILESSCEKLKLLMTEKCDFVDFKVSGPYMFLFYVDDDKYYVTKYDLLGSKIKTQFINITALLYMDIKFKMSKDYLGYIFLMCSSLFPVVFHFDTAKTISLQDINYIGNNENFVLGTEHSKIAKYKLSLNESITCHKLWECKNISFIEEEKEVDYFIENAQGTDNAFVDGNNVFYKNIQGMFKINADNKLLKIESKFFTKYFPWTNVVDIFEIDKYIIFMCKKCIYAISTKNEESFKIDLPNYFTGFSHNGKEICVFYKNNYIICHLNNNLRYKFKYLNSEKQKELTMLAIIFKKNNIPKDIFLKEILKNL